MIKHRILVADDHPVVRAGLVAIVNRQADMTICAEVASPSTVLSCVERERPSALLLDLFLGRRDGLPLIENLTTRWPDFRILVISMQDEDIYAARCREAGAWGFVSKLRPTSEIVAGLRTILGGSRVFKTDLPPTDQSAPFLGEAHPSRLEALGLTPREAEVLHWIAEGKTSPEMARILGCSPHTVDKHAERVLEKLAVESRTAAAAEVRRHDRSE